MRLFFDSSVLISASLSSTGASRVILDQGGTHNWLLLTSPFALSEVTKNLRPFGPVAEDEWRRLRENLVIVSDRLVSDHVTVFEPAKDKPILFTALAEADILLTLDHNDFGKLGMFFYGLEIMAPGEFLERQREQGNFKL